MAETPTIVRTCCGREAAVVDSRPLKTGVRRRRACRSCGRRWTTYEVVLPELSERDAVLMFVLPWERTLLEKLREVHFGRQDQARKRARRTPRSPEALRP